ncbi:hypothetical protein [Rice orange leaf phytoplasma]|uniref:hypothetical protein n=1 Tax=Rice orange leaf phytoplasma TaxID=146897 RepID=UPI0008F5E36E|nr:hypothetical protein [Rice orange leaf phytoplasma]OIJ44959.1 hypothetical protein BHE82_00100 [Rice orange leaf phytoplasma]
MSYVSQVALITNNTTYNNTQQHCDVLKVFLGLDNYNFDEALNKSFDPTKARQLFNEVQEEYKEKNPQANHEAQIKFLLPKPEKEIENMVYSYLKQSLESVFTNSNLEIIISDEEYCDFILNIGDVYYNNVTNRLAFIFNLEKVNEESRNIVIDLNNDPLVEVFRKKYANNDDWKTYFFDKITSNNELIFNIGEFVDFIEKNLFSCFF